MRDRNAYFGACGGLLGIGLFFILINRTRNDVNITNRYFGDFLFSLDRFGGFPRLFRKIAKLFQSHSESIAQAIPPDTKVAEDTDRLDWTS
jgi:hypothetical protein